MKKEPDHKSIPEILIESLEGDIRDSRKTILRIDDKVKRGKATRIDKELLEMERIILIHYLREYENMRGFYGKEGLINISR